MKTKTIKGDLILTKDFSYDGKLIVEGNIICEGGLWNIKARNIKAWNIEAGDIEAWDIEAENIKAGDIEAGDIEAENIEAGDIEARDIEAWDIKAGDIDYWAVCYARNSFKCKSVKGRRENCKHFCLGKEIEILK